MKKFLITKNVSVYFETEDRTRMFKAAERCDRLEIIEIDTTTTFLRNRTFQAYVNEISSRCSYFNQVICTTRLTNFSLTQNDFLYETFKNFFKHCKTIDTVTIKAHYSGEKVSFLEGHFFKRGLVRFGGRFSRTNSSFGRKYATLMPDNINGDGLIEHIYA